MIFETGRNYAYKCFSAFFSVEIYSSTRLIFFSAIAGAYKEESVTSMSDRLRMMWEQVVFGYRIK